MAKKRIILSKKQLDEVCGWDSSYLDSMSSNPDLGDIGSSETSADGFLDNGYADQLTSDEYADTMYNASMYGRLRGLAPMMYRVPNEVYEEKEHGNARLSTRKFGAGQGDSGKSYDATKMAISRKRAAEKTMQTGATQDIKDKAARTLDAMRKNWGNLDNAEKQYNTAKRLDKSVMSDRPEGTKIKSAPKTSGNGKAHTSNGGTIRYFE